MWHSLEHGMELIGIESDEVICIPFFFISLLGPGIVLIGEKNLHTQTEGMKPISFHSILFHSIFKTMPVCDNILIGCLG